MSEPRFLDYESILQLHEDSLLKFGGADGIRERHLIESALGSAMNTYFYVNGDLYDIAATYGFHIAQA